jgi:hypothetical protein
MDEEEVLRFKTAGLEVHCREIELVQRSVGEKRRIVAPGRIYQQPDGSLRFTAYPAAVARIPLASLPIGVPVPEESYWDLCAEDRRGRRWTCERLHLDVDEFHVPFWRPIDQPLDSLEREETQVTPHRGAQFTGYIFRSLEIDPNSHTKEITERLGSKSEGYHANVMHFPIGEVAVHIRRESEYTVIVASTDKALPDRFAQRLLEALRFVFGRPLSWSASVLTAGALETTYLRGRPVDDRDTHFRMPVPHYTVEAWRSMAELLRCYYLHVVRDSTSRWHPLSIWWSEVLRAGSREMESLVLIAAVAVEGVINAMIQAGDLPPGVEFVTKEDASTWRLRTAQALEQLDCPERIRRRVDGLFPRMGGIGSLDVLFALERLGAVDKELTRLWRDARPGAAHGSGGRWTSGKQITRDADGLVTLLRQVTFWWIGYRGGYIDLAEGGWRYREYSPAQLAATEGGEASSRPQAPA